MSPVDGSIRSLGVSLVFDTRSPALACEALSASTSALSAPLIPRRLLTSAPLTWSGVQLGWTSSRSATMPETTAADIEVPPTLKYWPSVTQLAHRVPNALPAAYGPTMW